MTKQKLLLVDDVANNLRLLADLLKDEFRIVAANSGRRALEIAMADYPPDLILLDIQMPNMNGYEVCEALKGNSSTAKIPVIFVTNMTDAEDESVGLSLGAVDYISKPFTPELLKLRINKHLKLIAHRKELEDRVHQKTKEIKMLQLATLKAFSTLVDYRDPKHRGHVSRVPHYFPLLCGQLKKDSRFSHTLDDDTIDLFGFASSLHDLGTVGLPDTILRRVDDLTPLESDLYHSHAQLGGELIANIGDDKIIRITAEMAACHHENWDGSGYPAGLSGEEIPLSARIMNLINFYDEMAAHKQNTQEEMLNNILELRDTQIDPIIVDAFLVVQDQFWQTYLILNHHQ